MGSERRGALPAFAGGIGSRRGRDAADRSSGRKSRRGSVSPMMMSHAQIAGLVPHQGTMCLLETVESWDSRVVLCTAASHRDPNHPLRDDSMLPAVCGIEYAGQAIAVHCGLLAGNECDRPIGLLVAV